MGQYLLCNFCGAANTKIMIMFQLQILQILSTFQVEIKQMGTLSINFWPLPILQITFKSLPQHLFYSFFPPPVILLSIYPPPWLLCCTTPLILETSFCTVWGLWCLRVGLSNPTYQGTVEMYCGMWGLMSLGGRWKQKHGHYSLEGKLWRWQVTVSSSVIARTSWVLVGTGVKIASFGKIQYISHWKPI